MVDGRENVEAQNGDRVLSSGYTCHYRPTSGFIGKGKVAVIEELYGVSFSLHKRLLRWWVLLSFCHPRRKVCHFSSEFVNYFRQ